MEIFNHQSPKFPATPFITSKAISIK